MHSSLARRHEQDDVHAAAKLAHETEASKLDWPTYLRLRKSQRQYGFIASVPTTAAGFFTGLSFLTMEIADPTQPIWGLDPMFVYGGAMLGCTALGWLVGPSIGSQLWKLNHRAVLKPMEAKDKDFFEHIKRNRVDPSRQSVQNPVPDFYGEKVVGDFKSYRRWLRDQNAYRRKAAFGKGKESFM